MYWKDAFIYTLRETPAEAEVISHQLMTRAGMIMKLSSGIYDYLPLGLRVIRKIENIIREEMERAGSAELLMPAVVPSELWEESGRWGYYGKELLRFKDRKDNSFCIGPTHEEVVVDVVRRSVKSYRDLPLSLYQIQSKFRDEIRPRFGLMRGREFIMKDAYSFHETEECLDETYWKMHAAYTRIFNRMGLTFRPVEADSGAIGGDTTHEFHVLADSGEDTIIYCESCNYAANIEKAVRAPFDAVAPLQTKMEEVSTPAVKTIEEVSDFLSISAKDTVKMVVFQSDAGELYALITRGDCEVNEVKFKNALRVNTLSTPDDATLLAAGLTPGFMGPVNFPTSIPVYADFSVKTLASAVIGANKEDFHIRGAVPSRDFPDVVYGDFGFAHAGDPCTCGGDLKECRGIEVGQVFKLGKKYSGAMNLSVLDSSGKAITPTMGCYGIGVGRTAASAVEQNHDKDGIVWPVEIAPFAVVVLLLDSELQEAVDLSESLKSSLQSSGWDVLIDNRKERPGIKFKDADLVGFPIQVVIGKRGLDSGSVEVKLRSTGEKSSVSIEELNSYVKNTLDSLRS